MWHLCCCKMLALRHMPLRWDGTALGICSGISSTFLHPWAGYGISGNSAAGEKLQEDAAPTLALLPSIAEQAQRGKQPASDIGQVKIVWPVAQGGEAGTLILTHVHDQITFPQTFNSSITQVLDWAQKWTQKRWEPGRKELFLRIGQIIVDFFSACAQIIVLTVLPGFIPLTYLATLNILVH